MNLAPPQENGGAAGDKTMAARSGRACHRTRRRQPPPNPMSCPSPACTAPKRRTVGTVHLLFLPFSAILQCPWTRVQFRFDLGSSLGLNGRCDWPERHKSHTPPCASRCTPRVLARRKILRRVARDALPACVCAISWVMAFWDRAVWSGPLPPSGGRRRGGERE